MNKLIATAVLITIGLMLFLAAPPSPAQTKKTSKTGTIEIVESKDGKYRFTVRDAEGKYLGGSTVGHATDKAAREAVDEMKQVMASATVVSKKAEAKDKE